MKPKVVILSAFLSPLRSGAEACTEEIAMELCHRFDITIITARMRSDLPRTDRLRDTVPVIRVGFGCSFDKWLFPFLAPLAARKLKPDIIHAILETFAGLALYFCGFISSAKRMLTMQTTNRRFLKGLVVRSPDRVTAISRALVTMAEVLGRSHVIRIPNGLRLRDIPERPKVSGRILFAGRLGPMKGIDVLLTSFAKVCKFESLQVDHVHLHIVGDGSERQKLESLSQELGLTDRVTFKGFVPVPDVYEEFAEAEIFCGLSRSEAFGNVFAEAQAAGSAVIGTNVDGIPDIVTDGENGLLVPVDDVEAAVEALKKLLEGAELRSRLSAAGKENAQKYDWEAIANMYEKVYNDLLSSL